MAKTSASQKNNVKALLSQNKSIREVAKRTHVSKSKVQMIAARNGLSSNNKGGRPAKLNQRDVTYMLSLLTSGRCKTAQKLAKMMSEDKGIPISRFTVSRELHKAGMKSGTKKKKPFISEKNKKTRLQFAQAHKDWTVEDWKDVVFSDETKINRFGSDGCEWAWFRDKEGLQKRNVKQTVKHGGGGLMLWGCITVDGVGYLAEIEGTMDSDLYMEILEGELRRTIDYYEIDEDRMVFQQDNDSKHKAKKTADFLHDQTYTTMIWPSQSPDLNPIENCWSYLKQKLYSYPTPALGMRDLFERIEKEWELISSDYIETLYDSMPRRMAAVIKAKGMWTKY